MKKNCLKSFLSLALVVLGLAMPNLSWADTVTETVTLHPTGVSASLNAYNTSNAYAASTNTSYAYISCGRSTSGYIYYTFTKPTLPEGATITSVACTVGAYVTSTSSFTRTVQLYNGTTAMGSSTTISDTSSGSTTKISSTGTWTTDNIGNLVLRVNASNTSTNMGSQTKYLYFGGADLTITYTYDATPKAITSFTVGSKYIKVGATTTATLVTADGYTGAITYSISESPETAGEDVADFDEETGVITAKHNGTIVITAIPAAQDGYDNKTVTITVTVTTSHIPSNYSTSWTTSNQIYLYNKATGLYLGSGGHWGTEGFLKTTGLPFYMDKAASEASDATGVGVYSDSSKSSGHKVGYASSAQVNGVENHGLYIDAGTNYPAQTFSFYYNSDDDSYSIVPDAIVTGFAITGTDSNGKTVYLTAGGSQKLSWETTPYYWSMDSSNRLYAVYSSTASSLGTAYCLYSDGSTIYMSTTGSTCSIDDNGYFKVGSYYLTGNSTSVTSSSSTSSALGTKYEQGTTSKFYLTKNGGTVLARQNAVTVSQYSTTAIPDEARWFVVTKADLIEDFESATATNASPKEATFLLTNPDFSREVTQGWTLTNGSTSSSTAGVGSFSAGYTRIGNALFNVNAGPTGTMNTGQNKYISLEDSITGAISTTASYSGNGNGYILNDVDAEYANLPSKTSTWYNIPYGGFYNCRILGKSGSISQQVEITKAGYYRISCDGYVYNPSGASGVATFYAKNTAASAQGKEWVSATLPTNATFEDMTAAGITFYANGGTSDYRTSILVYIPVKEGSTSTMEIGVTLAGGTLSNGYTSSVNTFAEIDAMKIEYTGDPEFDIILDDTRTSDDVAGINDNYINGQVQSGVARTMYLKRSIKANQWNSIVLPVNISNSAFNTAFGAKAKLTKFEKCEENTIYFQTVDHSDETSTTPAMVAGTCYLVKPTSISASTTGEFSTRYAEFSDSVIAVKATPAVPVFQFNQVTLSTGVDNDLLISGDSFTPTKDNGNNTPYNFMGTYFSAEDIIEQYSYAINASTGLWNRFVGSTTNTSMDCKGFRCWIGHYTSDPVGPAKFNMVIDGEEVNPTDIGGVTVDQTTTYNGRVYNINGQVVGTAENINKLPKGIYISNGKKIIVK